MPDTTYPVFPVFAFLGFFISLIPLPWHLQAWNSGTCYYMIWTALACLNQFVNSIVWHNNALNPAPAWCEVSIRILMGATVGLPLSSMCINRRLYHIASSQTVSIGRAEKTRAIIMDTIFCVGFPLVFIAAQYIVQGHRYNIYENIGCYPAIYNTSISYVISGMWPVVIGLVSATYCVLSLRAFARRRLEFSQLINSNNTSLTMSRYFRLMALAATEIFLTTPLAIFCMCVNALASPILPWISWSDTHFNFSRVEQIPEFFWSRNHLAALGLEFTRWVPIFCALVFFSFFGFADEAKKNYRKAFRLIKKLLGIKSRPDQKLPSVVPSIGQYGKPKQPPTPSSFTASTGLPPYSPEAPSFYPMAETKTRSSVPTDDGSASHYDDEASTASIVDHDITESPKRLTWKSIILPPASRRYSSYL